MRLRAYIGEAATTLDRESVWYSAARSLVATATLTVVLFNPPSRLLVLKPDGALYVGCSGLRGGSLWCVGRALGPDYSTWCRWITVAVLIAAAIGVLPRYTCIPHWYVTISLSTSMSLGNGGDRVAAIVTLLLVPIYLGDRRTWQWRRSDRVAPDGWNGAAFAAVLLARIQAFIIYISTVVVKIQYRPWRDGSAMRLIVRDPGFGLSGSVLKAFAPLLDNGVAAPIITWLVLATELTIGLLILGGARHRRIALMLGIGLHVGIAVFMGLPTFAAAMIGLLAIAATPFARSSAPRDAATPATAHAPTPEDDIHAHQDHAVPPARSRR